MDTRLKYGNNREVSRLVQAFDERLRLSRASDLAFSNRLLEAEALLCPGGSGKASAAELDMLARISVKKSHFSEARKRWEQAIAKGEGRHEEFAQCLKVLDTYSRQWLKRQVVGWWVTLAVLTVWLVISIYLLVERGA